jgi:hypothetical protein
MLERPPVDDVFDLDLRLTTGSLPSMSDSPDSEFTWEICISTSSSVDTLWDTCQSPPTAC